MTNCVCMYVVILYRLGGQAIFKWIFKKKIKFVNIFFLVRRKNCCLFRKLVIVCKKIHDMATWCHRFRTGIIKNLFKLLLFSLFNPFVTNTFKRLNVFNCEELASLLFPFIISFIKILLLLFCVYGVVYCHTLTTF